MEIYIELEEAAKELGIKKITLLRAIASGKLEAIKLGRGYKVTRAALQKYIDGQTVNAAEVK
jgi:excisionase family DNA binding protein